MKKDVNFLPPEETVKDEKLKRYKCWSVLFLSFFIIYLPFYLNLEIKISSEKSRIADSTEVEKKLEKTEMELQRIIEEQKSLKGKEMALSYLEKNISWTSILYKIAENMDERMWLENISISDRKFKEENESEISILTPDIIKATGGFFSSLTDKNNGDGDFDYIVMIDGYCLSNINIADFLNNLDKDGVFKKVILEKAEREINNDFVAIHFKIKCEI